MNSAQAQLYLETNSDFTPENGWLGFDEVFPFQALHAYFCRGVENGSRSREWYQKKPSTKICKAPSGEGVVATEWRGRVSWQKMIHIIYLDVPGS